MRYLSISLTILAGAIVIAGTKVADAVSDKYTPGQTKGFGVLIVLAGLILLVLDWWREPLGALWNHLRRRLPRHLRSRQGEAIKR